MSVFVALHRALSRRNPRAPFRAAAARLALALAAAAVVLSGAGLGIAAAEPARISDFPSKEVFKTGCEAVGGSYNEGKISTGCHFKDDAWIVCDQNAKNCTYYPPGAMGRTSGPLADPVEVNAVLQEDPTAAPTAPPGVPVLLEDSPTPTSAPTETAITDATPIAASEAPADQADTRQGSGTTVGQPVDASGPASLTLVTATCAPGYDLFAPRADPAADCSEPTDGIEFGLEGNGTDATRTTGDDGAATATFTELVPGAYQLVGQAPTGLGVAFILDCTSTVRSFDEPFVPLAIVGPDGTLGVTLQAGEALTCAWYGVPAA